MEINYKVVGFFNNLIVSCSSLNYAKSVARAASREYDCQVQDYSSGTCEVVADYSCGRKLNKPSIIEKKVKYKNINKSR